MVKRPEVKIQGRTIIEIADGEFLVVHPDGTVRVAVSKDDAERFAKDWYRKDIGRGDKIGVGEIEWRD